MPKKRCCVFTFVKNEKVFLPIWLKYYSRFFDKADIYVLDHDSDDDSIQECSRSYGFKVIELHHDSYDDIWRIEVARQQQAQLLLSYEYVLYADADEIIVPNPEKYNDLRDYIEKCSLECVVCSGYEMLHIRQKEPAIDLDKSIFKQRKYWYVNPFYDKPLLANQSLDWICGFHHAQNKIGIKDNDLWLLHLHKMDYGICWNKHEQILNYKWNEECIKRNLGFQFRIDNINDFNKYFDTRHSDFKVLKTLNSIVWAYVKFRAGSMLSGKGNVLKWDVYKSGFVLITKIPSILLNIQII